MVRAVSEIEQEIRDLDQQDKERLLQMLLDELGAPVDLVVENAWREEVQTRSRLLDEGRMRASPAEEVLHRIRNRLVRT